MPKWLLLLLIFLVIFADEYAYGGQWKNFTVADGLVGPDITAIYQDSIGNLWFGTRNGGVSLFDGESFHSFTRQSGLLNGRIIKILEDKQGELWIMMMRRPDSQRSPSFREEGIVFKYDGKSFRLIAENEGLIGGISDAILKDRNGTIWLVNKYGLMKYDKKRIYRLNSDKFSRFVMEQGGADARIYAIFESGNGHIWMAGGPRIGPRDPRRTEQQGRTFVISFDGEQFHFFTTDGLNIVPNSIIRAIEEDKFGNIWFGGRSVLLKYNGNSFERVDCRDPDSSSINAKLEMGETIITWKELLSSNKKPLYQVMTNIRSFRRSENEWIIEGKGFQYRHKIAEISVDSIFKDNKGQLWFNNRGFIGLWNGKNFRHFLIPSNWLEIKGKIANYRSDMPLFFPGQIVSKDTNGNLWFSGTDGAYKFDGKTFQSFTVDDGLGSDTVSIVFESMDGKLWFGHNNGVTLFDPSPSVIENFTTREVLGSNSVYYIQEDDEGKIWFSVRGGIARYDGEKLQYFTAVNMNNQRTPIPIDRNFAMNIIKGKKGTLWFVGFDTNQIFQYENGKFQHYRGSNTARMIGWNREDTLTTDKNDYLLFADGESLIRCGENGLQSLTDSGFKPILEDIRPNQPSGSGDFRRMINGIQVDSQGNIWFAINGVGLRRFDGISVKTFSVSDGLDDSNIRKIYEDKQKNIWILGEKAIFKYDGRSFQKFSIGNITDPLLTIHQDSSGDILFIYPQMVARYERAKNSFLFQNDFSVSPFSNVTVRTSILDSVGNIWFATNDGAIKYDGKQFTVYTTENGLLVNDITDIQEDRWGNLWFATWGGGVAFYNGESFQIITTKDGLVHNNVRAISEDRNGNLWFATDGGITRYALSSNIPPRVKLRRIIAKETYTDFGKELRLPAKARNLAFEYQGFSVRKGSILYSCKLKGFDNDWSQPSPNRFIEYKGLKPGNYIFMVKALYKNSPYSNPPAFVRFSIAPYFWTQPKVYLPILTSIIVITAFIVLVSRLIVQRRNSAILQEELRKKEEYETQRVKKELNEARRMQDSLLPKSAPRIDQFELAGISIPAYEVGGDFYDYLILDNELIGIALVDVSGKGLRGAMNAVMAYGMLHEVAKLEAKPHKILSRLNNGLLPLLQESMFTALNLGILNPKTKQLYYSNAGQTYPIIKRNGIVKGIELGGLPLGILADTTYEEKVIDLHSSDYLIFYTDGLTDAMNEAEEVYGVDRLNELIRNAPSDLSANDMIQYILNDVQKFVGESKQYDDITLIVLRCMGT
ncbi:MAG: two-component regulator propeller domain-containing protein [Candidatus Poribacteria bacterium]